ncbi:hypothetical protein GCWU000324_01260 [Kingella oralis ATCC 51147]|uniref:Uncharacterized protein n=1 Tax=Kingella oralis ATCC 51147 TaxID=629741 RepID=C4GGJ2_9NEIS|nr:hypothetical protein GCWU000324_01260 [Kingella oralis ATCC 51147]
MSASRRCSIGCRFCKGFSLKTLNRNHRRIIRCLHHPTIK